MPEKNDVRDSMLAKLLRVKSSDQMMFCISCIVGVDWVTHPRASGGLSITSDGFVVSGGLFVGSAEDLARNTAGFMQAAELDDEESELFAGLYQANVQDWRHFAAQ